MDAIKYVHEQLTPSSTFPNFRPGDNVVVNYEIVEGDKKRVQAFRGDVTVLMIAHRLSTVLTADRVVYMDKGEIKAQGSFEEVRRAVPDFDRQANLMGL